VVAGDTVTVQKVEPSATESAHDRDRQVELLIERLDVLVAVTLFCGAHVAAADVAISAVASAAATMTPLDTGMLTLPSCLHH
jgi:hypothetical protein